MQTVLTLLQLWFNPTLAFFCKDHSTMSPSKDKDMSQMFKLSEDDDQQFKDER